MTTGDRSLCLPTRFTPQVEGLGSLRRWGGGVSVLQAVTKHSLLVPLDFPKPLPYIRLPEDPDPGLPPSRARPFFCEKKANSPVSQPAAAPTFPK